MRKVCLSLYFIIGIYVCISAQTARQYSFKHFSTLNGLISNSANAIVQDKDGYIWIATTHGLQRYDGNTFLTFRTIEGNPKAIPSMNIISIYTDRNGKLWLVGDNNNVGIFDTKKFEFRKAKLSTNIVTNPHQCFFELPTGEMLLLANTGSVFRYIKKSNQFVAANELLPMPAGWKLSHIIWDSVINQFWITADSGLVQLDPATKTLSYRGHNPLQDPVIKAAENIRGFTDVTVNKRRELIAVVQEKTSIAPRLFYYDPHLKRAKLTALTEQLDEWHIHTDGFLLQKNGRVWLYGMPFLAEWIKEKHAFVPVVKGAEGQHEGYFNRIGHVFEDREHNIWAATNNGVLLFNPDAQVFSSYDLLRPGEPISYDLVQAIAETKDGRIFVGTWRGGMYCYDKDLKPIPLPDVFRSKGRNFSIVDMGVHPQTDAVWITQEKGILDIFYSATNTVIKVANPIFGQSTIRQITKDTLGNMWLGTQSGRLIKWDFKKSGGDPRRGYELIYQTGIINKIHYDYQGYIWVGTAQNGLIKISTHTNKVVKKFTIDGTSGERVFKNDIKDITYYNDTTLLVAAGCLNIINKRTNKIQLFGTKEGLPSNTLESVQKDKNNIVWMGMTNGIGRLNFEKKIISYYDRRDGINYDKFMQSGVQQLSGGRIFFFTDHNFMVFDPAHLSPQALPPRPFITAVKLAREPLSIDSLSRAKRIALKYNNTSISIDFSAVSFIQQQKLHYYYKLEGLDKDWIHTDKPITAIYNYLPPGSYTFYVKTETIDGITNTDMASLSIVVQAPFWQTWWFYSLIALFLFGIWFLIDRERINKRKSLLQVRNEIATNLHNDISLTLSDINILSEMAKIKVDKNVEQSKEFIDQINNKSRYTIAAMDDMLWSIDPANDSMSKILHRIKEYTNELRSTANAEIDLVIDPQLQELQLEMKQRHNFFFLYKEAITFLIKNEYSYEAFVNIKLSPNKKHLTLEMLSRYPANTREFELLFKRAIDKRLQKLPVLMSFVAENQHVSILFQIRLKH